MPSTDNSAWSDWVWDGKSKKYYTYRFDNSGNPQYLWQDEDDTGGGHTAATPRSHQTTKHPRSFQYPLVERGQYPYQTIETHQYTPQSQYTYANHHTEPDTHSNYSVSSSPPTSMHGNALQHPIHQSSPINYPLQSQHPYTHHRTGADTLSNCSSSSSPPTAMHGNALQHRIHQSSPINYTPQSQHLYTHHRTDADTLSNCDFPPSPLPYTDSFTEHPPIRSEHIVTSSMSAHSQPHNPVPHQNAYTSSLATVSNTHARTRGLGNDIRDPADRGHQKDQEGNDKAGGQNECDSDS